MSNNNHFSTYPIIKGMSIEQNLFEASKIADRFSQENEEPQFKSQAKSTQNIDRKKLEATRQKLKSFVKMIGAKKGSKIRSDIMRHCNKLRMNIKQNLSFEQIQKMINNRIQKMVKNKRYKQNWSEQDLNILVWVVSKYADWYGIEDIEKDLTIDNWEFIANLIPGIQNKDACRFKWLSLQKNNLSDNNWSEAESNQLYKIVMENQSEDWSKISQLLYDSPNLENKVFRCPKQCRQHWNCFLNPQLKKGPWQKQEDLRLLACVNKNNGYKKWSQIVVHFNGRTQNSLKNRYNLIIQKQIKNDPKKVNLNELQIIKIILQRDYLQQFVDEHQPHFHKQLNYLKQDAQQFAIDVQNTKQIHKKNKQNQQKLKQSCNSQSRFRREMAKIRKANRKKNNDSQDSSQEYSPPKKNKNIIKQIKRNYDKRQRICVKKSEDKNKNKKTKINTESLENKVQKINHYSSFNQQKSIIFKQSNLFDLNAGLVSNILQNSKIFMNSPLQIDYQNQKSSFQGSANDLFEQNNPVHQINISQLPKIQQQNVMTQQTLKLLKIQKTDLNNIKFIKVDSEFLEKFKQQFSDKDKKINFFVPCVLEKQSNQLKYFNFQE